MAENDRTTQMWCGECGLRLAPDMPRTVWNGHTHKPISEDELSAAFTLTGVAMVSAEAGDHGPRAALDQLLAKAGITEQALDHFRKHLAAPPQEGKR